jgi:rRNA-processing protein EBP2
MSNKASKQHKRTKEKGKAPEVVPAPAGSRSVSPDTQGSDVDEEGMARLMAALGEDGLDEIALQSLNAFDEAGEDESDGDGSEVVEGEPKVKIRADADSEESGSDSEGEDVGDEEEEGDKEEGDEEEGDADEDAVELDEVSSVDEDAVPRQKIVVDNKVRRANVWMV